MQLLSLSLFLPLPVYVYLSVTRFAPLYERHILCLKCPVTGLHFSKIPTIRRLERERERERERELEIHPGVRPGSRTYQPRSQQRMGTGLGRQSGPWKVHRDRMERVQAFVSAAIPSHSKGKVHKAAGSKQRVPELCGDSRPAVTRTMILCSLKQHVHWN